MLRFFFGSGIVDFYLLHWMRPARRPLGVQVAGRAWCEGAQPNLPDDARRLREDVEFAQDLAIR